MKTSTTRFSSYDGLELEGELCLADDECFRALLVHGIQSYRDEYGFYSDMAAYLSGFGCSSFRFDWRFHFKDSPVSLVKDLTLSGLYNDIESAVAILEEAGPPGAEKKPLVLIGASFGGGIAAYWAQRNRGRVSQVVLCAPVLDYEQDYLIDTGLLKNGQPSNELTTSLDSTGYVSSCGRPFSRALVNELRLFNPSNKSEVPITIIHGDSDSAEPYAYSVAFCEEAYNVKLITIPGADHGFAAPGDSDLNWPETKLNHQKVYALMKGIIQGLG